MYRQNVVTAGLQSYEVTVHQIIITTAVFFF